MTVQRSTLHLGGGDVSVSMLGTWWRCPRLFYWTYLHPLTEDTQGIEPVRTASPLLVGGGFHEAIEAYYLSGWRDGKYQLEPALSAARKCFAQRRAEFTSDEQYEEDLAKLTDLLHRYHRFYGPDGTLPEYPTTKILSLDDKTPMIEKTFTVSLGFGGYKLNVRPDALVETHGFVCALEHKTTGSSNTSQLLGRMAMDAQSIAEMAILRECLPEHDWNGVLVNVCKTKTYVRSKLPPFERQLIHYPRAMVDRFMGVVRTTIRQIEDTCATWTALVDQGIEPIEAASRAFPMVGLFTGACVQYSRCAMYPLCSAPGRETQTFPAFRPRTYHIQEEPDA